MLRPYWTGHIKFFRISFPVELYSAIEASEKIALRKIHLPTGKRIHHQEVAEDVGPVPHEEVGKGYEYSKGHYVTLASQEMEHLRIPSKKTVEIMQCVSRADISSMYYEHPYYLVPSNEEANAPYRVLREALRETGQVGLGQIILAGKERIAAISPLGKGMLLETLRYSEEVREPDRFFEDIGEVDIEERDQVVLVKELIHRKVTRLDLSHYEDHYYKALGELIQAKIEKRQLPEPPKMEEAPTVMKLQEALRQSLKD